LQAETYGHAVILICEGELTADSLGAFRREVDHQLAGQDVIDLVLNLEKVPFIDSDALEYLLNLHETLAERFGQVKLAKPDENIRKILEITRLESNFEIFETLPEAVKVMQN
ncbi:MAG: STAS domain-containing protein, partial [Planctomycetota bacterium]